MSIVEFVQQAAGEEGFDLAGIASTASLDELAHFAPWIEAGRHGEMHYLARRNEDGQLKRAAVANAAPWARSAVVVAANYNPGLANSTEGPRDCGWIARYALAERDYHDLLLERLRRLEARLVAELRQRAAPELGEDAAPRTWCYVDTGPVVERVLARHAGLGWIGKNGCLINPRLGSWLLLGVILCAAPLPASTPAADRCGSCTRCLAACPTQALLAPHQLDARRCISYLTIENRSAVPDELRSLLGRQLVGCDLCQEACPWNRRAPRASDAAWAPCPSLINPPLGQIAEMSEEQFRQQFRHSSVRRVKRVGLLRAAALAMGNSRDSKFLPPLRRLAASADAVLAEHARWAIRQIEKVSDS